MKYNNKLELIEAIKDNSKLFVEEYSNIEEVSINTVANFKNFRGKIRKWKKNNY